MKSSDWPNPTCKSMSHVLSTSTTPGYGTIYTSHRSPAITVIEPEYNMDWFDRTRLMTSSKYFRTPAIIVIGVYTPIGVR